MERQELDNSEILKYEDFESLRCDKCKGYLNCPNIMMYISPDGQQKPYTECGRCFNSKTEEGESLPKPIRNISAETLAAVTPFPCKYYCNGCRERRTWPKINLHEQECMFRIFELSLFKENPSLCLSGIEIIKKYREEYPNLILQDGVITLTLDKDFEQPYLIQQNTDLFTCKVQYDVGVDKAWFTISLLENRSNTECNIELSDVSLKTAVTLRIIPNSEPLPIDFKSIKALLGDNVVTIKCRVYLNMRLLSYSGTELLKEIQCPSCWDYMKGRIVMCSSGHSVCWECTKSLKNCPVCRDAEIQTTRNFALEKVISQAFFPCKNHADGCSYICTLDEVICHQSYCRFNCDEESEIKTLAI